MAAPHGILIHYAELGTKGLNKRSFVKRLMDEVRRALGEVEVDFFFGRLWVHGKGAEAPEALERLGTVPGIANYARAVRVELDIPSMRKAALTLVPTPRPASFRVRSKRVFAELPLGSLEVDHQVGGFVKQEVPELAVRMKGAELEIHIEMLPQGAFVFANRKRGVGGLPVGTGGLVAVMMSGGIDSPVAAYRMMRRGCRLQLIHFHSQPFLSRASADKAVELGTHLSRIHGPLPLSLVPLGELQREVVTSCPMPLRVVLYRRFMMRLAGALALKAGAKALVTGESLGQVASQTLSNMTVIDEAAPLTVLRPLVGFDKQEIIDEAKRIGTFTTSIQPDQDCCTLFVPRAPETHARLAHVLEAERAIDGEALIAAALARVERVELRAETPAGVPVEAVS